MTAKLAALVRKSAPADLTPAERSVLVELARLAKGGTNSPRWSVPDKQLQEVTGYSEATVKRARRGLVARGLVDVTPGVGRSKTFYRLLAPALGAATMTPQRGQDEPSEGSPRPLSTEIAPPIRARTGLYEVPEPAAAPCAPPPQLVELTGLRKELAEELWRRRLRAPCMLSPVELELVDAAIERVGVHAMADAAYRAHRPRDPARSWRAWLRLWAGLQPPPAVRATGTDGSASWRPQGRYDPERMAQVRQAFGGGPSRGNHRIVSERSQA